MGKRFSLKSIFGLLRTRANRRPDSEAGQALVRIVVYGVLYYPVIHLSDPEIAIIPMVAMCNTAVFIAITIFFLSLIHLKASPTRRCVAMLTDVITCTLSLHAAGSKLAVSLMIYLWVTFGYGVRYGIRYLVLGLLLGECGLVFLLYKGEFWSEHSELTIGFAVGFAVLSIYVGTLIANLNRAKLAAEKSNQAKGRFLASMSHEIRTPLTAITGACEALERVVVSRDARKLTTLASEAANDLVSLLNNVLDFTKADTATVRLHKEENDLYKIITNIFEHATIRAGAKNLTAQLIVSSDLPRWIQVDAVRLGQILNNLMVNAIKFTPIGVIRFIVSDVGKSADFSRICFQIEDSGTGIDTEHLNSIFEPFSQVDSKDDPRYSGVGLGLAIVRELVSLFDGQIEVNSTLGRGTEFKVVIPVRAAKCSSEIKGGRKFRLHIVGTPTKTKTLMDVAVEAGIDVIAYEDYRDFGKMANNYRLDEDKGDAICFTNRSDALGLTNSYRGSDGNRLNHMPVVILDDFNFAFSLPNVVIIAASDNVSSVRSQNIFAFLNEYFDKHASITLQSESRDNGIPIFRILLCDDSATTRTVIEDMLRSDNHRVTTVSNGQDAVEEIVRGDYDAALLDVHMPRINGIKAARFICDEFRRLKRHRPRVILLTADSEIYQRYKSGLDDVDAAFIKPINAADLRKKVYDICNKRGIVNPLEHCADLRTQDGEWNARDFDKTELDLVKAQEYLYGSKNSHNYSAENRLDELRTEMWKLLSGCQLAIVKNDVDEIWELTHRVIGMSLMTGMREVANAAQVLAEERTRTNLEKLKIAYQNADHILEVQIAGN